MRSIGPLAALALSALVLAASCAPGQLTYVDRVKALSADRLHPRLAELIPLLEQPGPRNPDDLVRSWKEFVSDESQPLRQESRTTFVYYDFTHRLERVYLEASFAPDRKEALVRLGSSALFYRVYDVPRPNLLRYRFTDGTTPLADPFRADVTPGGDQWHQPVEPALPIVETVLGVSEAGLGDQDITLVLPPGYRRNLAWTYPLLVVAGMDGDTWTGTVDRMLRDRTVSPFVTVSLKSPAQPWTAAALKSVLEDRVIPWVRTRYRVSELPADLTVTGWGSASAPVREMAAGRPDFWTKAWVSPPEQTGAEAAWSSLAPEVLKSQYPVVTP